jgi:hypothetical protein
MTKWIPPVMVNIKDLVSNPEALSARRRKVLFEILPKVLGGAYKNGTGGNPQWTELGTGYNPAGEIARDAALPKPGSHTTTCGSLPGYVAKQLGVPTNLMKEGIASCGLNSVRTAAQKQKAWTPNSAFLQALAASAGQSGQRPLPGDIYALCETHSPDSILVHIGIIVRPGMGPLDHVWWTADAGQGAWPDQECRLVQRDYEMATCMMTGESTTGQVRNKRMLAGWVDIDKYPFMT